MNEASAAITDAVTRELGLAEDIVNVEGGAMAHRTWIRRDERCPRHASAPFHATRWHQARRHPSCIGGVRASALALESLP